MRAAAELTDACASRLLGSDAPDPAAARARLRRQPLPEHIQVSRPEGYAYYGLDPRGYAGCLDGALRDAAAVSVIGVRSIGTSLSAVVCAALRGRRTQVERMTVRPSGHPWARQLRLSDDERAFVRRGAARGARFAIVDEGPGMSGSTFLAVGQALEEAGVACADITLVCGHCPDLAALRGEDAARRFRRYQLLWPSAASADRGRDLSAGRWRELAFGADRGAWPACWAQLERTKRLTEGSALDKFEGYAPYCRPALARAELLAEAGFAPPASYVGEGRVRYPWLAGRRPRAAELDAAWIEHLARYCTFRTRACSAPDAEAAALTHMLRVNVREALGIELDERCALELRAGVVADARMQPHEWLMTPAGERFKLDGHADGDAHLFPGPCDVAWDLAGAIVEWHMDEARAAALVRCYERQSGDRVGPRLPNYVLAYCALRLGVCTFASWSADAEEAARLQRAHAAYRSRLEACLAQRDLSR